jgi:hypothetical protein
MKEKMESAKKAETEEMKRRGRRMPCKDDDEKERELAIVATKGVVQLFNTVSDH